MFTGPTGTIEIQRGQLEASTRETGPNDFGRVVWALGVFFFFPFVFFSLLNYLYRFYRCYRHTERLTGATTR